MLLRVIVHDLDHLALHGGHTIRPATALSMALAHKRALAELKATQQQHIQLDQKLRVHTVLALVGVFVQLARGWMHERFLVHDPLADFARGQEVRAREANARERILGLHEHVRGWERAHAARVG